MKNNQRLPGSVELVRRDPQCAPGTVIIRGSEGHFARRPSPNQGGMEWLAAVKRNWLKLALFVIGCTLVSYLVSKEVTPMYEATSLVEVDYQQPTGIVGQDALRPLPSNDTDDFLATQVKLVTSDHVLRPIAEEYDLLKLEKQVRGKDPGADRRVRNAPIVLKQLRVGRQVGTQLLSISYSSPSPDLSCSVVNRVAERYVNRVLELRINNSTTLAGFMSGQLNDLKAKMDRSNATLARYESEMGMINPEQRTSVLSARLMQLTAEYTKVQGERMQKEASFSATKNGTDGAAQVSGLGDILDKIDERRISARENLASIGANFGRNYPDYRKAEAQVAELDKQFEQTKKNIDNQIGTDYSESLTRENMLNRQIQQAKAEYDLANKHVFSYEQLKREADDDKVLYDELQRKVRESSINAGFQNQTIRVVDTGRPASKPTSPNIPLNVAAAAILSALLGVLFVVARHAVDGTLRDARLTGERLNVQVLGVLPSVSNLQLRSAKPGEVSIDTPRLRGASNRKMEYTLYDESIRKLRNTVDLAVSLGDIRTLMVTSAMPGEGKSTTAADLALSFAQQQKKTLLIDTDLRRPVLHRRFGINNHAGTADLLMGTASPEDVIQTSENPYLFLLPSGRSQSPANTMGPALSHVLADLRDEFDLIVLDGPPILPFAESILIAASVDTVVFVTRSGKTTVEEAESALSILDNAGAKLMGVVLNAAPRTEKSVSYQSQAYSYFEKN